MTTIVENTVIAYLTTDKGWGANVKVTIAGTEAADKAAAAFFKRVCAYTPGENYHVSSVDEEWSDPNALGKELYNYFYPECEHGISASLCAGPNHYPADREW